MVNKDWKKPEFHIFFKPQPLLLVEASIGLELGNYKSPLQIVQVLRQNITFSHCGQAFVVKGSCKMQGSSVERPKQSEQAQMFISMVQ